MNPMPRKIAIVIAPAIRKSAPSATQAKAIHENGKIDNSDGKRTRSTIDESVERKYFQIASPGTKAASKYRGTAQIGPIGIAARMISATITQAVADARRNLEITTVALGPRCYRALFDACSIAPPRIA